MLNAVPGEKPNAGNLSRREFIGQTLAVGCIGACLGCQGMRGSMRYCHTGELHRDFHASTLDGINYLLDNYGEAAAREVLAKTGTAVYGQMHRKLQAGDASELLEFWRYYLKREDGQFDLAESADGTATLTVGNCPALRHLERLHIAGGKRTCWATRILNESLCQDSPFEIVLEETGTCSCRQILRRKEVRA